MPPHAFVVLSALLPPEGVELVLYCGELSPDIGVGDRSWDLILWAGECRTLPVDQPVRDRPNPDHKRQDNANDEHRKGSYTGALRCNSLIGRPSRGTHTMPQTDPPKEREFKNAKELLDVALALEYFKVIDGKPPAIPYHRIAGKGRLVVLVGDNASGKSFVRRMVCTIARRNSVEAIHISMESRSGPDYTGGMRSFVYGLEEMHSTGQNSVGTVLGGMRTCKGRTHDHIMFWDEPDVGLSDSWAAGMGVAIRDFAADLPDHTRGVFLVTHSKAMVSQLFEARPHFVYFGDDPPMSMSHWFERPIIPRNIEELPKLSRTRFLKLQAIIHAKVNGAKERDKKKPVKQPKQAPWPPKRGL